MLIAQSYLPCTWTLIRFCDRPYFVSGMDGIAGDRVPHQISWLSGYSYIVPSRSTPVSIYPSGTGVALRWWPTNPVYNSMIFLVFGSHMIFSAIVG
jgi:hypothetical protein